MNEGAGAVAVQQHAFVDEIGDRLAQRRARHVEQLAQHALGRQQLRLRETSGLDLAPKRVDDGAIELLARHGLDRHGHGARLRFVERSAREQDRAVDRVAPGRDEAPFDIRRQIGAQGLAEAADERDTLGAQRIQRVRQRRNRLGRFADDLARTRIPGSRDIENLRREGTEVAGLRVRRPARHPQRIAAEMAPQRAREFAHRLEPVEGAQASRAVPLRRGARPIRRRRAGNRGRR